MLTILMAANGAADDGAQGSPDGAYLNYGRGPLPVKDNFVMSHRSLQYTQEGAKVLDRGRWEGGLTIHWSNSFGTRRTQFFVVDGETIAITPSLSYGVNDWLEVGIDVPTVVRTGGAMDGFIEAFHSMWAYSNMDRDRFEEDDFDVRITGSDGRVFREDDTGYDLGKITLKARANLTDGGNLIPAVTLGLDVALPTGSRDELSGSDGVDAGFYLYLSKRVVADFYLHVNGGATVWSDPDLDHIDMENVRANVGIAFEWACSDATSIVAQLLYHTAQFAEGTGNLQELSFTYLLGVKTEPWKDVEFHFGVVENELKYDNSADFGVQGGVSFGW